MIQVLADLTILFHFIWIGFLILGFPVVLVYNNAVWRLAHLGAIAAAAIMQATGALCPLTLLEAALKGKQVSGAWRYPGDFIPRILESWIYVDDAVFSTIKYAAIVYAGLVILSFFIRPVKLRRSFPGNHG